MRYRGVADDVVPHRDVVWLRHGPWQERTLLEAAEYELWKVTQSPLPFLHVPETPSSFDATGMRVGPVRAYPCVRYAQALCHLGWPAFRSQPAGRRYGSDCSCQSGAAPKVLARDY